MQILNYKNRLKAAYDVLFNPIGFSARLSAQEDKKIESAVRLNEQQMTSSFEEKLRFISRESEHKQLCNPVPENRRIALVQIPLPSVINQSFADAYSHVQVKECEVEKMRLGIADHQQPLEQIKHVAARQLASKLIDSGFIQSNFQGRHVELFIQVINP